jgi:WD40 repeat protein
MERMELRAVNGVTVTGPTRISSNAGTFCWTSGPFVTIAEGERGLDNADYVSVKVRISKSVVQIELKRSISCLALSPDKKRLVTGEAGKDPCVRVWCRESKKYAAKFSGHRFEIINVAWHPEGRHVLSCGDQHDRQVFIWCLKTNARIATSRLQQEPLFSLFFSAKTFITVGKGELRSNRVCF